MPCRGEATFGATVTENGDVIGGVGRLLKRVVGERTNDNEELLTLLQLHLLVEFEVGCQNVLSVIFQLACLHACRCQHLTRLTLLRHAVHREGDVGIGRYSSGRSKIDSHFVDRGVSQRCLIFLCKLVERKPVAAGIVAIKAQSNLLQIVVFLGRDVPHILCSASLDGIVELVHR